MRRQPKVKAIIWGSEIPPVAACRYNHVNGESPLGRFVLAWKGWKDSDSVEVEGPQGWISAEEGLIEAKRAAQDWLDTIVLNCLDAGGSHG